jgi:hypothetical protein
MPAVSDAQRKLMAIAEHHPEKVKKENRSVLNMSHKQLHDFAATKGLTPRHPGALSAARRKVK